jgi:hypothetical protein
MDNMASVKTFNGQIIPRRSFTRWKDKPFRTKDYLELLAHYGAELVQTDGRITVNRRKTGTELPLEQRGKLQMVTALLDEFGTIGGANKAVEDYQAAHS